jgi:hypothetical protein
MPREVHTNKNTKNGNNMKSLDKVNLKWLKVRKLMPNTLSNNSEVL